MVQIKSHVAIGETDNLDDGNQLESEEYVYEIKKILSGNENDLETFYDRENTVF